MKYVVTGGAGFIGSAIAKLLVKNNHEVVIVDNLHTGDLFRLKEIKQKRFIFDEIRKKYIELAPEEWVRQNCVKFLINDRKFKRNLISIEKRIKLSTVNLVFLVLIALIIGLDNDKTSEVRILLQFIK